MKYITSALVIFALLGDQAEAVALTQQSTFSDDLIKSLTEDMAKDEKESEAKEEPAKVEKPAEKKAPAKDAKKDAKAPAKDAKKDAKKEDKKDAKAPAKKEEQEDIPMDAAAIKAYSSVIADAAEDSEPSTPVEYHAVIQEDEHQKQHEVMASDPMGSMIQNEISEIKDASIKAAKDKSDE
jgi:hypothetical protein